jgi:predicted MPP superfamily phosphohydrolase
MMILRQVFFISILTTNLLLISRLSDAQSGIKIFLVGDGGDHEKTEETLLNLKKELLQNPHSAVVFLGDNSYRGLLGKIIKFGYKGFDSSSNTINKVNSQLNILDGYRGHAFFIPGNHDWWNRTTYKKGAKKLAMEESFIEKRLRKNKTISNPENVFLPAHGAYGPDFADLDNDSIRLIFIDTYRIVQTGIKKSKVPAEENLFYPRLDSLIREAYLKHKKIIIVAHHPVYLVGPYTRTLKHPYLFRRIKASNASFPSYKAMSEKINLILKKYPGIFYASGHLHALQYLYTQDSIHYIISGAGSKTNSLSENNLKKYTSEAPNEFLLWETGGFFEVDFDGNTQHTYIYYNSGEIKCEITQ